MINIFNSYEKNFSFYLENYLSNKSLRKIDESAAPSFIHKNLLVRRFFYQRIREAIKLSKKRIKGSILDFGTGSGILLKYCSENADKVYGLDIDVRLAKKTKENFSLKNVEIIKYEGEIIPLPSKSIDFVFALEVLEHVDNPEKTITEIARVIRNNGYLLFSGPTENFIYKVGRFFSGFKGDYHKISVGTIQKCFEKKFRLEKRRILYKFLPFYIFGLYQRIDENKN